MSEHPVPGVRDRLKARYGKPLDLLAPHVPAEPLPALPESAKPKRPPRILITQPTDATDSDIRMCRDCGALVEPRKFLCDACRQSARVIARDRDNETRRERRAQRSAEQSLGMPCPRCGERTRARETRYADRTGALRRRRDCACGFRGHTVERWDGAG